MWSEGMWTRPRGWEVMLEQEWRMGLAVEWARSPDKLQWEWDHSHQNEIGHVGLGQRNSCRCW